MNRPGPCRQLASAGEPSTWRSAMRALMASNRGLPDTTLERGMVDARIRDFRRFDWPPGPHPWSEDAPPLAVDSDSGLPEIGAAELGAPALRRGILGNGALIVRQLMPAGEVAAMRDAIDQALAARENATGAEPASGQSPWFYRSPEVRGRPAEFFARGGEVSRSGSVWAVDAPRPACQMLDFYHRVGLPAMLEAYFGEPAVLSVKKWVLRRVAPGTPGASGWHQDGRFLGDGIRTVNLWIALSDCGGEAAAPGMDLLSGTSREILPTGTHGAPFEWTVGQGLVDELAASRPVVCPRFAPGDALFFDHYNLHRTSFQQGQSAERHAVESWFFAGSRAPQKQNPLIL